MQSVKFTYFLEVAENTEKNGDLVATIGFFLYSLNRRERIFKIHNLKVWKSRNTIVINNKIIFSGKARDI